MVKEIEGKEVAADWDGKGQLSPTYDELIAENSALKEKISHCVEMDLQYSPVIDRPPFSNQQLYTQACSGDVVTINSWNDTWLKNIEQNCKNYDVSNNSVMSELCKNILKPTIIAGSGPSLKKNVDVLAECSNSMSIVSCLHNYGFFQDKGVDVDYYINLDAGEITIPEVSQGGAGSEKEYWESTKDKTLVAALVSNPKLIELWQGKILWFNTISGSPDYVEKMRSFTDLNVFFDVGGNALGACMYMAKAILGSNPIAFVGADFCFSYRKKFHPFDSPYDEQFSGVIPAMDVYGNRVATWPSYMNFKVWFDFMACGGNANTPGEYINCTEGGILGAYQDGNIKQIKQCDLKDFVGGYVLSKHLKPIVDNKSRMGLLY